MPLIADIAFMQIEQIFLKLQIPLQVFFEHIHSSQPKTWILKEMVRINAPHILVSKYGIRAIIMLLVLVLPGADPGFVERGSEV